MERMIEIGGLSDELLNRLDERASQVGVDRGSYVRHLIERAVAPPSSAASLAELLGPVHDYTDAAWLVGGGDRAVLYRAVNRLSPRTP
jgi:hypothetical protein